MKAKEKHKINLLKFLGNWENDFPTRTEMANILRLKKHTLWKHFSPAELQEIENEGIELRKKNTARPRAEAFQSLLAKAKSGNVQAIKEFLDRTEGKVKEKIDLNLADKLSDEEIEKRISGLFELQKAKDAVSR